MATQCWPRSCSGGPAPTRPSTPAGCGPGCGGAGGGAEPPGGAGAFGPPARTIACARRASPRTRLRRRDDRARRSPPAGGVRLAASRCDLPRGAAGRAAMDRLGQHRAPTPGPRLPDPQAVPGSTPSARGLTGGSTTQLRYRTANAGHPPWRADAGCPGERGERRAGREGTSRSVRADVAPPDRAGRICVMTCDAASWGSARAIEMLRSRLPSPPPSAVTYTGRSSRCSPGYRLPGRC